MISDEQGILGWVIIPSVLFVEVGIEWEINMVKRNLESELHVHPWSLQSFARDTCFWVVKASKKKCT